MSIDAIVDDEIARARIRSELDTNMLVEAGAGSGKTTALVGRMLALVARGTLVDRIAAVTFTHKSANELRERFQLGLEKELREAVPESELAARYERALRELDRAFLGTIHSFCGRLLREKPFEVGLDPNFQEVSEDDWTELIGAYWRRWIDRASLTGDAELRALESVGVDPRSLDGAFAKVMTYPDVDFALAGAAAPDVATCRAQLLQLLARATSMMPRDEPTGGWDALMRLVRRLTFMRASADWSSTVGFCEAIETISSSHCDITQKSWSGNKDGKAAAKALSQDFHSLLEGSIATVLCQWREHRYPVVMAVLLRATQDFERERHATGQLGFEDLLVLAAKLLREHPAVRDELGDRYAHLLVDEFQDTDPIQAEVCFLLASDSAQGSDWRTVSPRAGALFVVGDPKQSIYRFRRADIQIYELVKRKLGTHGAVLSLTRNFRSTRSIASFVNEYFGKVLPIAQTPEQAPFSSMQPQDTALEGDRVQYYTVRPEKDNQKSILSADAEMLGSWIAERISRGERTAGDFLILTATKKSIESHARALTARNVAVTTTGAPLPQERELRELLVVLRAIADPENGIAIVAALEGLFFGLTPADLFDARSARLDFRITMRPHDDTSPTGRALLALHEWWSFSQQHAVDTLIENILSGTGLLFHAASQTLGDVRAGALLHLVEVLRAGSTSGGFSIGDAMDRIAALLRAQAADAPLRPGRGDAVRVMNLHQAKGLEAKVVVLASPLDRSEFPATAYVDRGSATRPTGGLLIESSDEASGRATIVAQPPGWAEMAAKEAEFDNAEQVRLLYVATTRPLEELVVGRCERQNGSGPRADRSHWSPLAATLDQMGALLTMRATNPIGRSEVRRTSNEMRDAAQQAGSRLCEAATPSFRVVTVTESAKREREDARAYDLPSGGAGIAWGRAVHRCIEGMGRGRSGDNLRAFVTAVARDEQLDAEQSQELHVTMDDLSHSEAWSRLQAAGIPHFELSIMSQAIVSGVQQFTEGVIDAAVSNGSEWIVIDWKTDDVSDALWEQRRVAYTNQVGEYAKMLSALTGQKVTASIERVRTA